MKSRYVGNPQNAVKNSPFLWLFVPERGASVDPMAGVSVG